MGGRDKPSQRKKDTSSKTKQDKVTKSSSKPSGGSSRSGLTEEQKKSLKVAATEGLPSRRRDFSGGGSDTTMYGGDGGMSGTSWQGSFNWTSGSSYTPYSSEPGPTQTTGQGEGYGQSQWMTTQTQQEQRSRVDEAADLFDRWKLDDDSGQRGNDSQKPKD